MWVGASMRKRRYLIPLILAVVWQLLILPCLDDPSFSDGAGLNKLHKASLVSLTSATVEFSEVSQPQTSKNTGGIRAISTKLSESFGWISLPQPSCSFVAFRAIQPVRLWLLYCAMLN